jgi:hypothetical protein
MTTPITSIRNLGPATAAYFARAGITTAEELYALGAHEAYRRWLEADLPPHFIGYYVLEMGLQGRPWNDCKGAEKAALRARFDALKAEVAASQRGKPPAQGNLPRALDQALSAMGVLPAP